MSKVNLNDIPELIESGKISKKTALQKLAVFVQKEGSVFGLQRFDDDFRSEVIVCLLERGIRIFDAYNPKYGTFFTYFFCLIKGIIQTNLKTHSKQTVKEYIFKNESIIEYDEKMDNYRNINYNDFEKPKIPFAYKKIEPKALELACKSGTYHIKRYIDKKEINAELTDNEEFITNLKKLPTFVADKIIMVLALKASYYITGEQIETLCEVFALDKAQLYAHIQKLKQELEPRELRKIKMEQRRNSAYFHHRKYRKQITVTEESEKENSDYNKMVLDKKYAKQTSNWQRLNTLLKKGTLNLRPTNKAIADVLGLCERQISHYLATAEKIGLSL